MVNGSDCTLHEVNLIHSLLSANLTVVYIVASKFCVSVALSGNMCFVVFNAACNGSENLVIRLGTIAQLGLVAVAVTEGLIGCNNAGLPVSETILPANIAESPKLTMGRVWIFTIFNLGESSKVTGRKLIN